MNKRTIDKDVYERYVDATVALFMEYYSVVSLPESIQAELTNQENQNVIFPTELDQRCRQLIKKELARHRWKQYAKNISKGLRYVAACVIAVLSLASFLFMTVEAVRVPIINYYIEQYGDHWEIFSQANSDSEISEVKIDVEDPLANLIPKDYKLTVLEGDSINEMMAIYENAIGERVSFSAVPGDHWIAIDSENAEMSQQCEICGYDAIYVIKDGSASLTWVHEELTTVFTVIVDDSSDLDIVSIVEQIINII